MKGTKHSVVELILDVEQGSSLQTAQVCLSKHGGHSHLSAKAISLRSWSKGMHCTICFYYLFPIQTFVSLFHETIQNFKPGWPTSTMELIGRKSFIGITNEEHKRLRRLTATPVNGHEALSIYMQYIEDNVISALNKWAAMGEFEFLTALRKLTFKIIMYIFLSSESEHVMEALEREYTSLNYGVRSMAINLPGMKPSDLKALARKNLVNIFQSIVNERRDRKKGNSQTMKKDMMDALLDIEDENGRKLSDEEIIDILVMYLNAGHESSAHVTMWATVKLQENPEFFPKSQEQEEIIRKRPPNQKRLTLKEIREMEYLPKVIDETLRWDYILICVFREQKQTSIYVVILFPRDGRFWFGLDPFTLTLKHIQTQRSLILADGILYSKTRNFPSLWIRQQAVPWQ
ncbi:Ent-kaurenoic acid oxidase 1 [Vitis vinifera]|uniref:Ent-kaurenoic acid oxidase 1 n=1 Tax=Vitis vinifera TaxID=29760 RepID=A0A438BX83_VITVI|nr:Ent-kaurenoic acid oxidase 1 [Vitis vinifera]